MPLSSLPASVALVRDSILILLGNGKTIIGRIARPTVKAARSKQKLLVVEMSAGNIVRDTIVDFGAEGESE